MPHLHETIYGNSFLLGKDVYIDGKHRIENIPFDKYLRKLKFIDHPGPVHNLAVVWYEHFGETYITQIYDHDTGEVYWEEPSDEEWTDEDDELTNALLMYANLEQTIHGGY